VAYRDQNESVESTLISLGEDNKILSVDIVEVNLRLREDDNSLLSVEILDVEIKLELEVDKRLSAIGSLESLDSECTIEIEDEGKIEIDDES